MARHRLVLAGALAAAGIASFLYWRTREAPLASLELRFTPGTDYEYTLSWQNRQSTFVDGTRGFSGHVDLRGRLVLHAYRADERGYLVGVKLSRLDTHEVAIAGRALLDDPATAAEQLATSEALLEVQRDGAITAVTFDAKSPALFEQLVPVLASQLEFRFSAGREWRANSPGPFGASSARYARVDRGAQRSREAYATLAILPGAHAPPAIESTASVALAPAGHWTHIVDAEHVVVRDEHGAERADARVALALELVDIRQRVAAVPSLSGRERRAPGIATAPDREADRRALIDKVGGLSREQLLGGLETAGSIPDVERWLWQATGLLELEPGFAAEVGTLVETGALTGKSAELALDLLASTGTPPAQAALVAALASSPVRGASNYGLLVQRASLIEQPTVATASFIGELYRREGRDDVAFTLGAIVRHLDPAGADAARWNGVLVAALEGTTTPARQSLLLGALGNAGRADNVALVVRHAASPDPTVRAAAARALRHTDVTAARAQLHALASDHATVVQREAIAALAKHRLGEADLVRLERTFATAPIGAGNESSIVSLVSGYLDRGASGANILRAIAARRETLPELRARIEQLLQRRSS